MRGNEEEEEGRKATVDHVLYSSTIINVVW